MIARSTVSLRAAGPRDASAMAAVMVAAWRHGYPGIVPEDVIEAQTVARWEPVLATAARPDAGAVVAVDAGGRLLGFARFGPDPDDARPGRGYLSSLYVDPEAAGDGIGRRLLERALRELAQAGFQTVSLWVFRDNARGRALYERGGFRADGAELIDERWGAPQVRLRRELPAPPRPHPTADLDQAPDA